jgi:hypothetical protein
MSDHPAVRAHYEGFAKLYGTQPDEVEEEAKNVPNHKQLIPYLEQLPNGCEYRVFDPEAATRNSLDGDMEFASELRENVFGLWVEFNSTGNQFDDTYGGCQFLKTPQTDRLGLRIWVNGCEASSAPDYFVVPVE